MIQAFNGVLPKIDSSAFVHERSFLAGDVEIGAEASLWPGVVIRGDVGPVRIGARTNIQDNSVIHVTGGRSATQVGERVTVGHLATLHGCIIGDDCLIGMGAIVMDDVELEPFTFVGAGSLLTPGKRYPGGVLILGRPGKVVRELNEAERLEIQEAAKIYVQLAQGYPPPARSS